MRRAVAVVSAGLGRPSSSRLLADRLAEAAGNELRELGDEADMRVVEVREHAHDLVNNLVSGYPSPELRGALDTVAGADGLIVVTPTFTASYSGLFKAFFEVLDLLDHDALTDKPVLIAATGGTARHSLVLESAMRPLFTYLRCVVVPTSVFAAPEDWGGASAPDLLARRIGRAAAQLAEEIHRRGARAHRDPFEPTPFQELLDGG
ncbi:FMN reductase [Planotetraspora thailandica]|uniref:FMN reductase n=1 Tax=Planotetraspora thailandica TaxID=487172 RepID=A0A8J3V298_9ACTN|nr:FMN reductase [Planotetraspora thailandica]GII54192.1 FMN reductase [Planotetraspora thailandica]